MIVELPIFIQELPPSGPVAKGNVDTIARRVPIYQVRPLYYTRPVRRGPFVQRLLAQLSNDLMGHFQAAGSSLRHDDLALWQHNPHFIEQRIDVMLVLRQHTLRGAFPFVAFEAMDRHIVFTPLLPSLWFEYEKGEHLADRATEILTEHYRQLEKQNLLPSDGVIGLKGKAWISSLKLTITPKQQVKKKLLDLAAIFGGGEQPSGKDELHRVGRSLDALYPDELERAVLRGQQVQELSGLLENSEKRPVLLLGPRKVGKTALIHECVFLRLSRVNKGKAGAVWQLAPQRLISGMSFIGQWENRLLAILKYAKAEDLVLIFDDLPGLFQAGRTSQSDLSVANVLKPFLERRDIRVVAEATPEVFSLVQELDRGLADLFHVLPVPEPTASDTWRMMIEVVRRCEGRYGCRFELDVLPTVMDLMRRYVRESSFPGKAAELLSRLAGKYAQRGVTRSDVLGEFHLTSGLSLSFLDDCAKLPREEAWNAIASEVVGQPDAVDAVVDAVSIAKARLNDPGRPLGTFLFLGPTGVGKTQCAKSLAKYLFGDAERLLRFDMNGMVDRHSVPRLVGTLFEPEGLLTSAVRRQPFAVVLFDEIEKAHPDVFDLLLQVLGEGRLTDALGRTVDFTNTIVILTSNLGVREASSEFGFGLAGDQFGQSMARQEQERQAYIHAASRFFRPEFFNRLDRIVPFRHLSRQDTERIARDLIRQLLRRDGLIRRRCVLRIQSAAMARIVDEGYHPRLGARALKRSVERQLTRPIATCLAGLTTNIPTLVSVYPGNAAVIVETSPLMSAPRQDWPPSAIRSYPTTELLDRINEALDRIDLESQKLRPRTEVRSGRVTAVHTAYYALREQLTRVDGQVESIERQRPGTAIPNRVLQRAPGRGNARSQRPAPRQLHSVWKPAPAGVWKELFEAEDLEVYLKMLATAGDLTHASDSIDGRIVELLQESALLDAMLNRLHHHHEVDSDAQLERVMLQIETLTGDESEGVGFLAQGYAKAFSLPWGTHVIKTSDLSKDRRIKNKETLIIEGSAVAQLAGAEVGTHLFVANNGELQPVRVEMRKLLPDEDPGAILSTSQRLYDKWMSGLAAGTSTMADDPNPLRPTLRLYDAREVTIDFRTGLMTRGLPTDADLYTFMLAQLTLPRELTDQE